MVTFWQASVRRRGGSAAVVASTLASALFPFVAAAAKLPAQIPEQSPVFTRADTLRGTVGPARAWWDVTFYDLHVAIDPEHRAIEGSNAITFEVVSALPPSREMQIDLQAPLMLDSVTLDGMRLRSRQEGDAWFVTVPQSLRPGEVRTATAWYHGVPIVAANPPWDGGFIWAEDDAGRPWVATANQGLGASVWWPNKDVQSEEPDSQRIVMTVPTPMIEVSNGRLRSVRSNDDGTTTWEWFVSAPINNYGVAVNAGSFAHWHETYDGLDGPLTLEFWPLATHLDEARRQWPTQTRAMLRCFEDWFGPYPWYRDGFKLIEAPHLGMEHQSAIAYGNGFQNGYLGRDLSHTGRGLTWDFIIVHESAHEWWGNNLTTEDVADMWIHEGFANYAENLFVECWTGSTRAGAEYVIGTRANILNDEPIIGAYGVQDQGSGDMYYKGGNLLHTIRQWVADDALWKSVLRQLQADFRHQIVTSAEIEREIARRTGLDLAPVFDQYLRTTQVPVLEWQVEGSTLQYRWADVVEGFEMPVDVRFGSGWTLRLRPARRWQSLELPADAGLLEVDEDWYVEARRVALPLPLSLRKE